MPNIKSQEKRDKTNKKAYFYNRHIKRTCRTYIKKVILLCEEENLQEAKKYFSITFKKIDKAVQVGVYHKNNAARKKQRLHTYINDLISKQNTKKTRNKNKITKD